MGLEPGAGPACVSWGRQRPGEAWRGLGQHRGSVGSGQGGGWGAALATFTAAPAVTGGLSGAFSPPPLVRHCIA